MKHTYKKTEDKNYAVTLETGEKFNCVVAVDESEIEELVQCYLDSKKPSVYASPTYKELRSAEYNLKSMGEQFGMQYDDAKNGTTTWVDWQAEIKARITE